MSDPAGLDAAVEAYRNGYAPWGRAVCPFCEIAAGRGPATFVDTELGGYIAIVPLNPVTEGHTLIIPTRHALVAESGLIGEAMARAAVLASRLGLSDYNLILNAGPFASQTVEHMHVHLVPRRSDDGLALPWSAPHIRRAMLLEAADEIATELPYSPIAWLRERAERETT